MPTSGKWTGVATVILLGLLFCTLACLEFPELSTLTDDESNDFIVPAPMIDVAGLPSHAVTDSFQSSAAKVENRQFSSVVVLRRSNVFHASRDLLHLYSIQRT